MREEDIAKVIDGYEDGKGRLRVGWRGAAEAWPRTAEACSGGLPLRGREGAEMGCGGWSRVSRR